MKLLLGLASLFLLGCATNTQAPSEVSPPAPALNIAPGAGVDYQALKSALQMDRDRESLGISEKSFNTCDAGYGYSPSQNCHREYFVVLNFRLLCRDSEGTISQVLTDADLRPLERRNVHWVLKGVKGTTTTDSDGYGQIVAASQWTQKNQRIRVAIGNEFLYMRAGEFQKVITPRPWCDQY